MRLIRDSTWRKMQVAEVHLQRELEANRWLAEFDWLLQPLWDFLVGKYDISVARDLMRNQQSNRLSKLEKVAEAARILCMHWDGQPEGYGPLDPRYRPLVRLSLAETLKELDAETE